MSMIGGVEGSSVCSDILAKIQDKILENSNSEEIVEVLRELEEEVRKIQQACDSGWY